MEKRGQHTDQSQIPKGYIQLKGGDCVVNGFAYKSVNGVVSVRAEHAIALVKNHGYLPCDSVTARSVTSTEETMATHGVRRNKGMSPDIHGREDRSQ